MTPSPVKQACSDTTTYRKNFLPLVFLLVLLSVATTACQKDKQNEDATGPHTITKQETPIGPPSDYQSNAFSLQNVRIDLGANVAKDPRSKTKAFITTHLINDLKSLKEYNASGLPLSGTIMYDSKVEEAEGKRVRIVAFIARFELHYARKLKGHDPDSASILAQMILERDMGASEKEETQAEVDDFYEKTYKQFIEQVEQQLLVYLAPGDQLGPLLLQESLVPEAQLAVINRIRDEQAPGHDATLAKFLDVKDPRLVVAAAGALTRLGNHSYLGKMIERSKEFEKTYPPAVSQLLLFLAELGGPEAYDYLKSLATSSPSKEIMASAKDAIEKGKRAGTLTD